jgi:hypothetical protein
MLAGWRLGVLFAVGTIKAKNVGATNRLFVKQRPSISGGAEVEVYHWG